MLESFPYDLVTIQPVQSKPSHIDNTQQIYVVLNEQLETEHHGYTSLGKY